MTLLILAVGRLRPAYREACDEYLRRLGRYAKVTEVEVREASRAPTVDAQREEEAGRLRRRVPDGATLVTLTRQGSSWTSEELARRVEGWRVAARPLVFVLGGSHGLSPGFLSAAAARWSLGPLTLPHELARVVVAEQLYRAFTILGGQPYHKG
ncbi:MAG TPA: 23S rRNA (pseudouridine(1915)-N(3))-methyltransferase RlmH [Gemmatimonadales bacterium]|nr:23S rRNA (pseudouridine(1915)-N(3))-methyltransferase RlmH [Gemmatimonadales bacterium]